MTNCNTQQPPHAGQFFVPSFPSIGDLPNENFVDTHEYFDECNDQDEFDSLDDAVAETVSAPSQPLNSADLKASTSVLYVSHRQDLERSGLSPEMISAMACKSASGTSISQSVYKNEYENVSDAWNRAGGYVIPYIDSEGKVVARRWKMFWNQRDTGKPKYFSVSGADTHLYVPPGFDAVYAATDYLIITEGEKKAAKAVQEGFPCVAIAGVDMWSDSTARRTEKANHQSMSPATPLLKRLAELATKRKCLVVFDSDAREKYQVLGVRRRLKDALLFQAADWVREMDLPVPEQAGEAKVGLDDLLVYPGGTAQLDSAIKSLLGMQTQSLTPIYQLPHGKFGDRVLYYIVPNLSPRDHFGSSNITKDVVEYDGEGGRVVVTKEICSTRVWLSRVIHSADEDGDTLYELSFVPHTKRHPERIVGGCELLKLSQAKEDLLGNRGAMVEGKYRSNLENFLVDCQKYGPSAKLVRITQGTRQRGWRGEGDAAAFVMASKVVTSNAVSREDDPDAPLIPIPSGSDDTLRHALKVAGDEQLWRRAIITHILPSPVAMMYFAAGLAGLLRYWCAGSENFIMHLYGASSGGKTTVLKAAASAWGNPKRLIDTWKATSNGIERKAVGRNDMAMFLDEAGMADEHCLVDSIYSIGNGSEKIRATRDVRERKASQFRLVALSTGEKQLVRGTKFAGQEVRAIELRTDQTGHALMQTIHSAEEAEELVKVLEANYGHAIEPMIRGILSLVSKEPLAIQTIWERRTDGIRSHIDRAVPPHIMRRVKHFGLCLAAIDLFLKFVLQYEEDEIEDFSMRMTRMIVTHMAQLDTDQFAQGETNGILQQFMDQLASCQRNFVDTVRAPHSPPPTELYGSIEGTLCFVIPTKLGEMMKPYDKTRTRQALESIDALVTKSAKKKTVSHRIFGARPDCYVIDIEKIERVLYKDD